MNISQIIAILNKADPLHNSNYQERQVALNMAHKVMDANRISYAALGFSQSDAERIENQFSVATGSETNNTGSSRTGYQRWNPFSRKGKKEQAKPKADQTRKEKRASDGNGREYNSATGNWEYTANANGNANPFQSNYEAPQDYQGSVPCWDGYNGE